MKTLKEMIAVMRAAADGKEIQACYAQSANQCWGDIATPVWNWDTYDYRVKPREPKVIYVNEYGDGSRGAFTAKAAALRIASDKAERKAVKYIEVIDEKESG